MGIDGAQASPKPAPGRRLAKARVLGVTLIDALIDIGVPLVIYLLLHAVGVRDYLALSAGGILIGGKAALGPLGQCRLNQHAVFVIGSVACALLAMALLAAIGVPGVLAATVAGLIVAVPVVVSVFGPSRVDGIGLLVLAELITSVVVTLISDDPRFLVVRPAIYTAVAGCYAFVTCAVGRPLMLDASKPMAIAGDPGRAVAFENAWQNSAQFRGNSRATTAGLGVVLLAESLLRVWIVYRSPGASLTSISLISQLPGIALMLVFVLVVRFVAVPRASAIVDSEAKALVRR